MAKEKNQQFVILSGIGMLLVMLGHLNCNLLTFRDFLPYYSYHVMLFVFISGYFYQPDDENHILQYIKRKALHLLVPYAIWNLVYGVLITLIHKTDIGIWFGEDMNLFNLFLAPFTSGHQYMLHAAAWFVPALFLLQLCNVLGRRILRLIPCREKHREFIYLLLYFLIGIAVIFLAKRGSVYDYYKLPGRLMLMAPIFQLGRFYRCTLEKKDTLPSIPYFLLLFVLQLCVMIATGGSVSFSVVWVTGFANGVIMPYITSIIGILFWLRVSGLLSAFTNKHGKALPLLRWMGTHSFAVMMHHLFGFFLLNFIFYLMHEKLGLFPFFDIAAFQGDIYYTYCSSGGSALWFALYLVFSLFIVYILDKLAQILYRTIRHAKS